MPNKNFKRAMMIIIALIICNVIGLNFIVTKTTVHEHQEQTVEDVISLVKDNDILIKNSSLTILYNGSTEELTQEQQLLNEQVKEIAICDDDENTITIFIK